LVESRRFSDSTEEGSGCLRTAEQRQLALRLKAGDLSLREIGPQVGCSHQGVALIVRQAGLLVFPGFGGVA
jgi:hypothetical protein